MNSIIVDNMAVLEAARHGWKLVRNNLLPMALMAMIIYFGVGMLTAVLIMPLMLPLFLAPVSFIGHEVNWILLAVSVACIAVLIPLFAVLNGLSMVFTKSAWVLTYLRLTRSPISSSLPPGATS